MASELKTTGLPEHIPAHVAIIMDGNGRWAKSRGLPRIAGHKAGTENLRRIIRGCVKFGIKYLTIYAFSTENWGRPEDEVSALMNIIREVIEKELGELHKEGVQLRHIGHLDGLDPILQKKVMDAVEITRNNDRLVLNIAFNYGGRDEILCAVKQLIEEKIPAEQVTPELFSTYMFTKDCPDPDLIIRTSGELRTSNFLIWQAAYSEWYFPAAYWPDFDEEELRKAVFAYSERDRRFGKVSSKED